MSLHDYLDGGPHSSTSSEAEQANLPVHCLQKLSHEDRDSGFHELVDDPATFELLPSKSPLASPELLHAVTALSSPAGLGDVSASFADSHESDVSTVSVGNASSTSSGETQPDVSAIEGVGMEKERVLFSPGSPSPAGSEEDVSGKESDDAFEDASGRSSPSDDELGEHWNPDLYTLQSKAPKPILIPTAQKTPHKSSYYGREYHGPLSREDAADTLGSRDGAYLVREGSDGDTILSFMLGRRMWNFKLYYENAVHFVGEKRFEEIHELVQDGLITLYLSQHNVMQALERGRNHTRVHSQKLKRQPCRRVKGPKGKSKSAYLERLRFSSFESSTPAFLSRTNRQVSSPDEMMLRTPNSNGDQSDLDMTVLSERRGVSTPAIQTPITSTPVKKPMDRRAQSTDSLQKMNYASKRRYAAIGALRDVVKADGDAFTQSMDISILSEKAAAVLGIARPKHQSMDISVLSEKAAAVLGIGPPKQYKRASTFDPELEKKMESEGIFPLPHRSHSFHPGMGMKKSRDKAISLPRDLHKQMKKPPAYQYYKAHKFKLVTYVHPTWCQICHHFLWGLKMQGLRCQDCGIDIHRQCCADSLDHECNPTKKVVKRVFGVDLTTLLKVEEGKIPNILRQCIHYLESTDLTEEGLYRVSGQTSEVLDLKQRFNNQEKPDLSRYSDINVVPGVVKLFLRELPIPVITFDAYSEVMKATSSISDPSDPKVDWGPLANALKLLPKAHYNVLKYLAEHLHNVDQNSINNKMTAYNLAVVFAPTLMRSPTEDHTLMKDIPLQKHFVELMILKNDVLFD